MHARPKVREVIVAKKMKRWALISKFPVIDRSCPPSRARKNFWRLQGRYPELAARLGLNENSLY